MNESNGLRFIHFLIRNGAGLGYADNEEAYSWLALLTDSRHTLDDGFLFVEGRRLGVGRSIYIEKDFESVVSDIGLVRVHAKLSSRHLLHKNIVVCDILVAFSVFHGSNETVK